MEKHLYILCFGMLAAIPVANAQQGKRPNFVIILADDLGYGDIGCYGNTYIKTPNLDRMASQGMLLTDFHANSALCTPSRAALLTGRYQQRAGLEGVILENIPEHKTAGLQPDEITFAKVLKDNGYSTALIGKWHLGSMDKYNPVNFGFEKFVGFKTGNVDYHSHLDVDGNFDWWDGLESKEYPGYSTEVITQQSIQFITDNKDKPFCLYMAHACPHDPIQGTTDPPYRFLNVKPSQTAPSDRPAKEAYRDMIEYMDKAIGEVLDKLKTMTLDRNTLVVFMSDNGPNPKYGSAGVLHGVKSSMFEGGHRVCGIMYMPSVIRPGTICTQTVIGMDLFPTIMEMTGIKYDDKDKPLDGMSLVPVIRGKKLPERNLYWALGPRMAVRDGRWKLIAEAKELKEGEAFKFDYFLYDMTNDVAEKNNLASQNPAVVALLNKKLKRWENDVRSEVTEQLVPYIPSLAYTNKRNNAVDINATKNSLKKR
jgi:arylsulfatase A-like enzyme